jgi:hypothetical protein
MADVHCPMCGKPNPEDLDECQFCGARLKPVLGPISDDSQTIKPAGEPTKRKTSELEKINLSRGAPIRPGEAPTKKNTAELERALPAWLRNLREGKRPAAGESTEEPTAPESSPAAAKPAFVPDSSEGVADWLSGLSKAGSEEEEVPDWLAGLRSGKSVESAPTPAADEELSHGLSNADWMARLSGEPEEPASKPSAAANTPAAQDPGPETSPESAGMDDTATWLKSLQSESSAAQEQPPAFNAPLEPAGTDDTPDWLKSLQSESSAAQEQPPAFNAPLEPAGTDEPPDWLKSLESAPSAAPEQPPAFNAPLESAGTDDTPDWLKSLESTPSNTQVLPAVETPPEHARADDTPDWLKSMQSARSGAQEPPTVGAPPEPAGVDNTPDWLKSLQSQPSGAQEPPAALPGGDNLPEWLSGLPEISAQNSAPAAKENENQPVEPAQTESMPDWLEQLKQKSVPPESTAPAEATGSTPDWLTGFRSSAAQLPAAPAENVPDWLSNLQEKSTPGAGTPAAAFSSEPQPANPSGDMPSWLSQLQADVNNAQDAQQHKDDFEVVPIPPAAPKGTGALPDWLSNIEPTASSSGDTPALIGDNKDSAPGEQADTAFSMETPDWLSKLNPEQDAEKPASTTEGQPEPGSLETAELPSWVQAMRPVESVVEQKTALVDENRIAEISGPLAGLRGVLPSEPGLGTLRKPPAYSTKLQVSDGQHGYAATLERMIASESNPRTAKPTRLPSSQILRWLIAVLLILAVGLPFVIGTNVNGVGIAPSTTVVSSDQGATDHVIDGLPANVPVLVAFDYDPALSGELEAVAAPVIDRLLSKGNPLVVISTSPTGPILAEHFLQTTPLVKDYQYPSGNKYINLGYLAGGPAGILYFADAPTAAITVSVDGQPAWSAGPLQAIQKLSDFAAVFILTDNADTGRNWIEQAGPQLGNTPMLMVISAQAEPMIRPYLDSGQLKGLVSGLSEAKIYEQSNQSLVSSSGSGHQFGLDNQYWDSFSVGMLVAELLIVAGVILGFVADWRARHNDSGGGA